MRFLEIKKNMMDSQAELQKEIYCPFLIHQRPNLPTNLELSKWINNGMIILKILPPKSIISVKLYKNCQNQINLNTSLE
jgi:hypothetical protein